VLFPGPCLNVSLESRQVSVPGHVGFREKGESVMETSELCGLVSLSKTGLLRVFYDALPDLPGEGLVSVGGDGKLAANPVFGDLGVTLGLVVDITTSIVQCGVSLFDVAILLIVRVELVTTGFVELTQILRGLLLLVCE
jgi:hypothetical protein